MLYLGQRWAKVGLVEEVKCEGFAMCRGHGCNPNLYNHVLASKPVGGVQSFLLHGAGTSWAVFALVPVKLLLGVDPQG